MKEIMEEIEKIAESRKGKSFINPISKLESKFKNKITVEAKEIKINPIINLSWYKDMVLKINKRANVINTGDKFYRFGVYIKFKGFLSIKYAPYVIKDGGDFKIDKISRNGPFINDVMKNFDRCGWCNRGINLKNKKEYGEKYNKILCCDCCTSEESN